MKFRLMLSSVLLVPSLALGAAGSAGDAATTQPASRVVSLATQTPTTYLVDPASGEVSRGDRLEAGALTLPAPVLGTSTHGYIQVQGSEGPVWLDPMDVTLDTPPTVQARCLNNVTQARDTTTAGVLGAGEGC